MRAKDFSKEIRQMREKALPEGPYISSVRNHALTFLEAQRRDAFVFVSYRGSRRHFEPESLLFNRSGDLILVGYQGRVVDGFLLDGHFRSFRLDYISGIEIDPEWQTSFPVSVSSEELESFKRYYFEKEGYTIQYPGEVLE